MPPGKLTSPKLQTLSKLQLMRRTGRPHEMEALKLLCSYCSAEAECSQEICFATMREKPGRSLASYVYDPYFLGLFKLVVQSGVVKWSKFHSCATS